MIEIVHAGAAKMTVANRKAGWLDNCGAKSKTGAHAQDGSGILRNVRLVKR